MEKYRQSFASLRNKVFQYCHIRCVIMFDTIAPLFTYFKHIRFKCTLFTVLRFFSNKHALLQFSNILRHLSEIFVNIKSEHTVWSTEIIGLPMGPIVFILVIQQVKVLEIKTHTANYINNVLCKVLNRSIQIPHH